MRDSWLQLAVYAVALTSCKPHSDWPPRAAGCDPTLVRLIEAQLLVDETRKHSTTAEEIDELVDLISLSAIDMELALDGQSRKSADPMDLPAARKPNTCQMCNFMKLCWKEGP